MLNKLTTKFSKLTPLIIIVVITFFVLLASVPSVYFITTLYGVVYGELYVVLSVVLPLLLTPPVIATFIKLSKHLKYFQDALEYEVEENKKKDLMLFEQARFALMGEMMANVSHQWKQPLNTINLALISSKFSLDDTPALEKNFDIIESNVNYLGTTIDDFLSFFDKRTSTDIRTLEEIVKEIKSISQIQMDNVQVQLSINIQNNSGDVRILSSISQVILNLLVNAKDAIEKLNSDKRINLRFIVTKESLQIVCCDNGSGIKPEIKAKIFDPYFTTKSKSQGTGIGLYMSKQIIDKIFEGKIKVDTSHGTCFYIDIPYSEKCILEQK